MTRRCLGASGHVMPFHLQISLAFRCRCPFSGVRLIRSAMQRLDELSRKLYQMPNWSLLPTVDMFLGWTHRTKQPSTCERSPQHDESSDCTSTYLMMPAFRQQWHWDWALEGFID